MKTRKLVRQLSTLRLYTAAIEQMPIIVYMANEAIGFGAIEEITDKAVKIDGEYYVRDLCTFYLQNNDHNLSRARHMSK